MEPQIIPLGKVNRRFPRWTAEFLGKVGDALSDGVGSYKILKPVRAVILADRTAYSTLISELGLERQVALIEYSAYGKIQGMSDSEIEVFFRGQQKALKDNSVAYWFRPLYKPRGVVPIDLYADEGYILVCVDEVKSWAKGIKKTFNEKVKGGMLRSIFKLVLLHEFCHHATLINLTRSQIEFLNRYEDENFSEGLANTLLHYLAIPQERRLLAEQVSQQGVPYRYYYVLRKVDISRLLDLLINKKDLFESLREFAGLVGGKLDLNGHSVRVGTESIGWIMDWSEKGGNLVAGERIEILGLFDKGCFVAPEITHLVGRYPRSVKVYANKIENVHDYVKLPQNIKIVSKEKCDLANLVKNFQWSSNTDNLNKDIESLVAKIESVL